ncbi:hypothetical protein Tco_0935086 [Tanacetum coccineum]
MRDEVEKRDKERHIVGDISSINRLEKPLGRIGAFNATRLEKPLESDDDSVLFSTRSLPRPVCYFQLTLGFNTPTEPHNCMFLMYSLVCGAGHRDNLDQAFWEIIGVRAVREAPEFVFAAVEMQDTSGQENQNLHLSGYHQKDRKPSQNDKTEHGMEKTLQNQGQSPKMSKSESILKNQQSNRSRN